MADGVIAHEEVLRHVYAFLQAYGYKNSLLALQNESRVPYNTLEFVETENKDDKRSHFTSTSPAGLERAVLEGQWDTVLATYVDSLLLPEEVMFDIYELVFEELLTLRGFVHAARAFFTNSPVFITMKRSSKVRYARLEQQLESQKNSLADDVGCRMGGSVPPHIKNKREALLKILQEAITWNTEPYDGILPAALWRLYNEDRNDSISNEGLLTKRHRTEGSVVSSPPVSTIFLHYPLKCPKHIRHKILFANAQTPTACVHTILPRVEDKQCKYTALIVGKTDGTVDFLDGDCATPVGSSVGHSDGVLSITLDLVNDGVTWVAVGYRDGWIKIYNTETRKLVRRFSHFHSSGVTSLIFAGERSLALSGHHSWVVSGSFDGTIQVLDIREGKSIQQVSNAHQSKYVLSLCAVPGKVEGVVSAGNNGTLCFWSVSSTGLEQAGPARSLRSIHASLKEELPTRLLPVEDTQTEGELLVLTRGQRALLLSIYFTEDAANPVLVSLRSTICTPRVFYAGCTRVVHTPALTAPLLSVFFTDREGTIMLYNVEMSWRVNKGEGGESPRGEGCRVELRPTDESSIIPVDFGKAVEDLNVVNIYGESTSLLAYSPSLSTMYILSWN